MASPSPSPIATGGPWRVVALLGGLTIFSYVDRTILAVLVEPVKGELALSDVQLALLMGLGFSALYAVLGLVIGRLADTASRRALVAAGVLVWGASTIASGWAQGFAMLLVLRMGVAVGEAVLTPSAVSLIADLFPPARRARASSVFLACSVAGAAGAYMLGALALAAGRELAPLTGMAAWRLAFPLVGVPSIVLGLIFLALVREPPRGEVAAEDGIGLQAAGRHLTARRGLYGPLFAGVALCQVATFSFTSWFPAMLHRSFGMAPAAAGMLFGTAAILGGVLGTLAGPWFVRGRIERLRIVALVGATAALLPAVLSPLAAGPLAAAGLAALALAALLSCAALPPIAVQLVAPNQFRAQIAALYGILLGVVGMGLAPLLVALASDNLFEGPRRLAEAMALVNGAAVLAALAVIGRMRDPARDA